MKPAKITKRILLILCIMLVGGLGGMLMDRYLFPYLSSTKIFSKYSFFQRTAENTTFINKTEQVYITENDSIIKLTNQTASSVVSILSFQKEAAPKTASAKTVSSPNRSGSGVIVTSDGLIMAHRNALAEGIGIVYKVLTNNGDSFDAELIGVDRYSQLAFLKINASNMSAISFSDSDEIKTGQRAIAIASGYQGQFYRYRSATVSFIDNLESVSGQKLESSESMQGVIDLGPATPIEYVGGPVIDYAGQTIGIVGSVNIDEIQKTFTLPSNEVRKVIERAIRGELDKSPILGIYYVPLSKDYAIMNSLPQEKGALIYSASGQRGLAIISGSPADKAGLRLGDVITKVNGQEIDHKNPLPELLYAHNSGDKITLTIMRNGAESDIEIGL